MSAATAPRAIDKGAGSNYSEGLLLDTVHLTAEEKDAARRVVTRHLDGDALADVLSMLGLEA